MSSPPKIYETHGLTRLAGIEKASKQNSIRVIDVPDGVGVFLPDTVQGVQMTPAEARMLSGMLLDSARRAETPEP